MVLAPAKSKLTFHRYHRSFSTCISFSLLQHPQYPGLLQHWGYLGRKWTMGITRAVGSGCLIRLFIICREFPYNAGHSWKMLQSNVLFPHLHFFLPTGASLFSAPLAQLQPGSLQPTLPAEVSDAQLQTDRMMEILDPPGPPLWVLPLHRDTERIHWAARGKAPHAYEGKDCYCHLSTHKSWGIFIERFFFEFWWK